MNTTDNKNRTSGNSHYSKVTNEEWLESADQKFDNSNAAAAERGYTVRDSNNLNRPNPDQEAYVSDDDLDDLDDDFHTDRDLEDNNDAIYEVDLEDEELDANGNDLTEVNDELDNPSDDFNETEDVLEDIDDDDEEDEEENDYVEDDVQEEDDEYPENDPRRF